MKVLGVLTLIAIGTTITSVIQAAVLGRLWIWFVATEYGQGPSMGAWFGISTILGLIVSMALSRDSSKNNTNESLDEIVKRMIHRWIGTWLGCVFLLGICWFTGSLLGWMH